MATSTGRRPLIWVVMTAVGCASLWIVAFALATRGLDPTDESYYLLAIAQPSAETATVRLFGFVYHPLYDALNGSIVLLRWAGLALTAACTGALAWVATRSFSGTSRAASAVLAAAAGTTSLISIVQFPLTPGYGALAIQATSLLGIGVIWGTHPRQRVAIAGWALVGASLWLAFLAKPTTAAVAAGLTLIPLAVTRRRLQAVGVSATAGVVVAGLTLVAMRIDPAALAERIRAGVEAVPGHPQIVRWDAPPRALAIQAVLAGCLIATLLLASRATEAWGTALRVVGFALLTAGVVGGWALWLSRGLVPILGSRLPAASIGVLLGAGALHLWARRSSRPAPTDSAPTVVASQAAGTQDVPRRRRRSVLILLAAMPFAVAFGTNLNLWNSAGRAGALWTVAALVLLARHPVRSRLSVTTFALVLVGFGLGGTALAPYRTDPFRESDTSVQATADGARLGLTAAAADRATELLRVGRDLGIDGGTPVIDLTGANPGIIAQLGARPVGEAWLIGGYPDSEQTALAALRSDPCAVGTALLLRSPSALRSLPDRMLEPFGLSVPDDYDVVGVVRAARLPWGGTVTDPRVDTDRVEILARRSVGPVVGCAR